MGPLALLLFSGDTLPSRGFWIECSAAIGFIAMAMFALQFVLTARFKGIAAPHGLDTIIQFHREAGLVAVAIALLHSIIMIAEEPAYLEFLDPRVMTARSLMLIGAVGAMLLIIVLTLGRERFRISYEWWRLSHGLMGLFVVVVALIHVMQVEWYVASAWQRTVWVTLTTSALLLLGHVRLFKPLQMWRRPYRVVDVRSEGARTWTVAVEPVGHAGMTFRPGQFAWLSLGPTPFSMQQHPFSIASSAKSSDHIEFVIRELGDFTSTIGRVRPGDTAFLEGPYGAFTPDLSEQSGLALIAGGVGIAPMMSILRTLKDRNDLRPVQLIYGSHNREEATFAEELLAMHDRLNFQVVFVSEAEEHTRINEAVLDAHLPKVLRGEYQYFICGPRSMMDMAETYLNRVGVPAANIHTERFHIA